MGQIWTGLHNSFKQHIPEQYLNGVIDTIFDKLPSGEDGKTTRAETTAPTPAGEETRDSASATAHDSKEIPTPAATPTAGGPKKKTVTYDQLHGAILEVFTKINQIPGANWAPPSREAVVKLLEVSDRDQNKEIDREEFREFVRNFCGHLVATYAREMMIVTVAVPIAATLTKRATTRVPVVGGLLSKVPNTVFYASASATAMFIRNKYFVNTSTRPSS